MTPELRILLQSATVLASGLAAARLLPRARASVRRLILASTFGALLALPVAVQVTPVVTLRVPVPWARPAASRPVLGAPTSVPAASSGMALSASTIDHPLRRPRAGAGLFLGSPEGTWSGPAIATWLRAIWAAGFVVLMTRQAAGLWRLRRLRQAAIPWIGIEATVSALARKAGIRGAVAVVLHEHVGAPLSYGLRPTVVFPLEAEGWTRLEVERALVHELEHVRRHDWVVQLAAGAVCAAHWFQPLAWIALRRLALESERACDDAVVAGLDSIDRADGVDYAAQLVTLAGCLNRAPMRAGLPMADPTDLSLRIHALLDPTQKRGPAGARAAGAVATIAVVLLAAIAPLRDAAISRERPRSEASQRSRPSDRAHREASQALIDAAARGDLADVNRLLDHGANANAIVPGDGSPLIVAAREGHASVVRTLLDRGADPDLAASGDGNPLIMASREGRLDVVTLLLENGAAIDHVVPGDENALIQASAEGRLEVVKLLVARGADVNARAWAATSRAHGEWRTPLGMARKSGHDIVARYLEAAGAVR